MSIKIKKIIYKNKSCKMKILSFVFLATTTHKLKFTSQFYFQFSSIIWAPQREVKSQAGTFKLINLIDCILRGIEKFLALHTTQKHHASQCPKNRYSLFEWRIFLLFSLNNSGIWVWS